MRQDLMYTPIGRARYPSVSSPHPKYGHLGTDLILTQEEADLIKQKYDQAYEALYAEECQKHGKKTLKRSNTSPFKPETREDGTETGNVILKFKIGGTYKDKASQQTVTRRLRVVDSQKKDVKGEVWGGSEIKVAFMFRPWFTPALGFGVGLKPVAVQVLKLVTKGDGSNAVDGFGIEEDGYVADESEGVPEAVIEQPTTEASTNGMAPAIKGNF